MKKIIIVLCLALFSTPVFAEHVYDYQNTRPINDINSIQTRGCNEYVKIEPKNRFDAIESLSGRRSIAGSGVILILGVERLV